MTPLWFSIIGGLLVLMSLIGLAVNRLPLTSGLIYLLIGIALGPVGFGILDLDVEDDSGWLLSAFEFTVLISLFSVGLKLRTPFADRLWRLPVMLASASMLLTIVALAFIARTWLHYPLGAALLLGAVMAPTDPVLASDVQVREAGDRDKVRFGVTAEGGLNDGTAFPFVMLGLGMLGLRDLGEGLWHWWAIDLVWAVVGGLLIGALCGLGVGKLMLWLRRRNGDPFALEEFLSLGLIGLSYGLACLAHALGFLAVLAAGIAIGRLERQGGSAEAATQGDVSATLSAPGAMAQSVLGFNERFERIAEVGAVLLLGGLMSSGYFSYKGLMIAAVLLLVIRPVSVFIGSIGTRCTLRQRWLMSWFGVRGVGSLYYLMYSIEAGLRPAMGERMLSIVMTIVAVSIVVHGVSGTPLMNRYGRRWR